MQAAYSDLYDANRQQHLLPGWGAVGTVVGASIVQLCPDQKYKMNGDSDTVYIPPNQR